jgi:hypothetical protein
MNFVLLAWLFFAPQSQMQESIEVRRVIIDAHVVDVNFETLPDLDAGDFRVLVDGKQAKIESVTWVDDEMASEEVLTDNNGDEISHTEVPAKGRLFILFVQTDFARNATRVVGEMGVISSFHLLVDVLKPADRVALLSFDSHLKLRLDFTTDRELLQKTFPSVLLIDEPPPPPQSEPPSLAALLDPKEMRNAGTSERGLILIARALNQIPGPKHVLLLGWGMGGMLGRHLNVEPDVLRAGAELASARATVYAFNFGLNGVMSVGLMQVAADTGGFYAGASPSRAFSGMERSFLPRLDSYLGGHYEIEIRSPVPAVAYKMHKLDVQVKRRGATVITKSSFVDLP